MVILVSQNNVKSKPFCMQVQQNINLILFNHLCPKHRPTVLKPQWFWLFVVFHLHLFIAFREYQAINGQRHKNAAPSVFNEDVYYL